MVWQNDYWIPLHILINESMFVKFIWPTCITTTDTSRVHSEVIHPQTVPLWNVDCHNASTNIIITQYDFVTCHSTPSQKSHQGETKRMWRPLADCNIFNTTHGHRHFYFMPFFFSSLILTEAGCFSLCSIYIGSFIREFLQFADSAHAHAVNGTSLQAPCNCDGRLERLGRWIWEVGKRMGEWHTVQTGKWHTVQTGEWHTVQTLNTQHTLDSLWTHSTLWTVSGHTAHTLDTQYRLWTQTLDTQHRHWTQTLDIDSEHTVTPYRLWT